MKTAFPTFDTFDPNCPPCPASAHLLCPLSLRVVVQKGALQDRAHNGQTLPCLELGGQGEQLGVHHVLILVHAHQHQQLGPEEDAGSRDPPPTPHPPTRPPHESHLFTRLSPGPPHLGSIHRNLLGRSNHFLEQQTLQRRPTPLYPSSHPPIAPSLSFIHPSSHPPILFTLQSSSRIQMNLPTRPYSLSHPHTHPPLPIHTSIYSPRQTSICVDAYPAILPAISPSLPHTLSLAFLPLPITFIVSTKYQFWAGPYADCVRIYRQCQTQYLGAPG